MSNNTKNYRELGGEKLVIGGEIVLSAGAKLTIDPASTIEGLSGVGYTPAANQADSTAATIEDLVTDVNSLLAKLQAAGLMNTE